MESPSNTKKLISLSLKKLLHLERRAPREAAVVKQSASSSSIESTASISTVLKRTAEAKPEQKERDESISASPKTSEEPERKKRR